MCLLGRVIGERFRNDGRLASDESSKSTANVGRSRGVTSRAGNNAHDNEMLSIIEELREADLIIN
ncbi:hypothetical protein ALC57_08302 [Trachymyrmex cornetzi]|uniref:Uncharacterized protein n=1 Tax=Trachymyrmex cornetzi TaxID=471704 RepID=A0A151J766_9HYME|nr:hypothetical protein ALC57_08302 [Trachymyrmex cornetzi]